MDDGVRMKASLCVLASGSGGNCSLLSIGRGAGRRLWLIDAGLSPRRTKRLLAEVGVEIGQIESILLTHLDSDHWRPSWASALPECVKVRLHRRHAERARRLGMLPENHEPFDGDFGLGAGAFAEPVLMSHDALGTCAYRFDFGDGASLGFATDLGRATSELVEHLRGVDVLAIESNYCPVMQTSSSRPWFLKKRIMGGSGHLSNEQAAAAVAEVGPRSHVVFLHLSRQCNRPELVAALHAGADYAVTITDQFRPSRWVHVSPGPEAPRRRAAEAAPLFAGGV